MMLLSHFAGFDVCLGNAGIVERGRLIDLDVDAWNRQLSLA
jgi:NAD(P)-dependent dehydrogenase (short-subunit alcohol dehydrogenase family)